MDNNASVAYLSLHKTALFCRWFTTFCLNFTSVFFTVVDKCASLYFSIISVFPPDDSGLCHVVVLVGVVLVTLHVIPVYQRLYPLLEVWRLDRELELVVEFGQEEVVRQRFPCLLYTSPSPRDS